MKYAHIDNDNKLLGWYSKDIHDVIPTPNIEASEEVWQNALNNGHNKVNQDGTTVYFDFRSNEDIQKDELNKKISEAKKYLSDTDYKMLPNYVPKANEDLDAIIVKRNETREFIRSAENN